jgi:hypothetical protein
MEVCDLPPTFRNGWCCAAYGYQPPTPLALYVALLLEVSNLSMCGRLQLCHWPSSKAAVNLQCSSVRQRGVAAGVAFLVLGVRCACYLQ